MAILCSAAALLIAGSLSRSLLFVFLIYVLINTAYSRWLKHMVLVDVFCIASGFLPRLLAGT